MTGNISGNLTNLGGVGKAASPARAAGGQAPASADFADTLTQRIEEVAKLQEDASQAVEKLMTGRTEDVSGVMTAVEKSDLAFKTLLAIRAKLMDAYDEIKNMQV